ncbi:immunoglobulin mu Fc receptor [Tenrec ecaudatus]|uniref:immunoglobulin mu Fc receptor n=1 Tax=Tenrec ecaudatus TaxID=94439 RepID=UPI003F5A172E
MDLWCWLLYLLPVSGALKIIPEVKMEGKLGGSITFKCPLSTVHSRIYLCREMVISGRCNTMVSRGKSGDFLKKEYSGRITLKVDPDKNLFLVEMTKMRKHDSGIYACGMGLVTDRDKTQKITLSLHAILSKRVRRLAIRMRALEASQRPRRPQVSPRQRSQNIYSACPLRARGANAVPGPEQATLPGPGGPEHSSPFQLSPAQQQVSEVPWSPAPSLKTSCEDVSFYHQPPAQVEDEESTDYVNMPSLTHLPSCPPEPGPLCQ